MRSITQVYLDILGESSDSDEFVAKVRHWWCDKFPSVSPPSRYHLTKYYTNRVP